VSVNLFVRLIQQELEAIGIPPDKSLEAAKIEAFRRVCRRQDDNDAALQVSAAERDAEEREQMAMRYDGAAVAIGEIFEADGHKGRRGASPRVKRRRSPKKTLVPRFGGYGDT